jgi:Ca-activated chloride channel family protein
MTRRELAVLAIAGLCAVAAGPDAWAKLFWRLGAPDLALPLLTDAATRGAALYAAGRYDEADATFAAVGRIATYNRGMTLAATGRYGLSVAYFDAVLFTDRYDADARHNRQLVDTLVDREVGEAMGHGRIKALLAEQGFEADTFDTDNPMAPIKQVDWTTDPDARKRDVTHDRTVAASEAWIASLADAPGEYLRARLAAELERRIESGEAAEAEGSRW